jgi:microcystin degradation protein MlrC
VTKVLLAGLYHETNTFAPEVTDVTQFTVRRGAELFDCAGDGSPIDGFLDIATREGWTVVPALSASAMPSGPVVDSVFESFWTELADVVNQSAGLDAIFLALHGAMVAQSIEDPEGEMLQRLRALPTAAQLPIFGVFDLHANVSPRMAASANGLVAYRENPHIDARLSACRVARLLARALRERRVPCMVCASAPILWPPSGTGTADPPMSELEALARQIELEDTDLWAVNVAAGFAFADVFDAGVSFSTVTTGPSDRAEAALKRLVALAEAVRERGLADERTIDEVLSEILPVRRGPVLLVEPADNIGGGAPGDGTAILRALLRHRAENAAVIINDAGAVESLQSVPLRASARLSIGGRGWPLDEGPVAVEGVLLSRSDGRFTLEDRHSHLAAMQGIHVDMGPCVVLRIEGVTVLLTSRKTPPFDLGQWRSQGVEPSSLAIIGVKAAVAHRRAYDPIAAASYRVRTPGPCASDLRSLPYRHVRRPIFPLD